MASSPGRHVCGTCGQRVSKPGVKQCRRCWQLRGADGTVAPKARCIRCGAEVSTRHAKLCRACWATRKFEGQRALTYDEAKAAWEAFLGRTTRATTAAPKPSTGRQRLLIISDLHVPFHEPAMLAQVLRVPADRVLLAGDLLDCYSLSRFVKYEAVPWQTEWAQAQLVVDTLAATFPRVDILQGNHEARLEKQIRLHLSEALVEAVKTLTGGPLDPLTVLTKPHRNVHLVGHTTPEGYTMGWLAQQGDLVVGHAEVWSDVPGSALRRWDERLDHHLETWGVQPYRLLGLPHTHMMGVFPWRGKLLIETGCLCRTHQYMQQPRGSRRPQWRGYVVVEQDRHGVTDLNSLHVHYFDLE